MRHAVKSPRKGFFEAGKAGQSIVGSRIGFGNSTSVKPKRVKSVIRIGYSLPIR